MASSPAAPAAVEHDPAARRFLVRLEGHEAELTYHLAGDSALVIDHTGVPAEIGGRGVAAQLVRAAFELARGRGWKVVPACSYAAVWAGRHPEFADLVAG